MTKKRPPNPYPRPLPVPENFDETHLRERREYWFGSALYRVPETDLEARGWFTVAEKAGKDDWFESPEFSGFAMRRRIPFSDLPEVCRSIPLLKRIEGYGLIYVLNAGEEIRFIEARDRKRPEAST